MAKISTIRKQIHEIIYSSSNQVVKPSGKLRFMTAYRFFRKDHVPTVKEQNPDLDGKGRQEIIKKLWRDLDDEKKFPYVLMSRADKERAIYINKLNLIMENLINKYPDLKEKVQVQDKINKYIEAELTNINEEESSSEKEEEFDEASPSPQPQ